MKYIIAALALLLPVAAQAQSCPYAAPGQTSGVIPVSHTISILATPGQVIDCSAFQFVATAGLSQMFSIISPNSQAVIKLGIVDGAGVAYNGVDISNFTISELDITALQNLNGNGVDAHNGTFAVFDNKITIGAIRQVLGNGFLAYDPSLGAIFNFQGNHVEIGQIIGSNASGLAILPGAVANTFIVGPVEHNASYGCYDAASGAVPANLKNIWIVNGANSNGTPAGANSAAAC